MTERLLYKWASSDYASKYAVYKFGSDSQVIYSLIFLSKVKIQLKLHKKNKIIPNAMFSFYYALIIFLACNVA